jgi:hypothetical protein
MPTKEKSRYKSRDFHLHTGCERNAAKENLGSAALTVAILVLFLLIVGLATLFRLRLASLALVMLLSLTGLILLSLPGLITLLTLLFRIVCHEVLLLESADCRAFGDYSIFYLVAAMDSKVGTESSAEATAALTGNAVWTIAAERRRTSLRTESKRTESKRNVSKVNRVNAR